MTLAQLAGGSGFVYVTKADGLTIVSNIVNDADAWQQVQKYISAPLTDPTLEVDATFGYRIFGNTAGTAGSLVGTTELTRFLVNRASQTAAYKKAATIATGVVTINRVGNNMTLIIDTEGAAASDTLDTLTSTDVVDNDTVTIIGANSARIVTVAHGTGNIFLANNANFASAGRQVEIVLRYYSAATAGWYEVSRVNNLPTVANQRVVTVPEPISGVETTALTNGGGTINLEPGVDKGYQVYTGTVTLLASWAIQIQAAPATPYLDGDTMIVDYRGIITPTTPATEVVSIFGHTLTDAQMLAGRVIAKATYKLSNTTWYYQFLENNGTAANGADMATVAYVDATFEPFLPASPVAGYVLSSDGVAPPNQGYNWIPITATDSGWVDLLGFGFLPGGSAPQYRLIGKELSFRGNAIVALDDGAGAIVPYANEGSYAAATGLVTPNTALTGPAGAVTVVAAGSIIFNKSAAVIPASAFPDNSYSIQKIAYRRVNTSSASIQAVYTAYVNVFIGATGLLTVQTLLDIEEYTGGQVLGNSLYRFITSKATTGDYLLNYTNVTGGSLQGVTAAGSLTLIVPRPAGNPTHAVTLDAANPTDIGGFVISLDGLKAYLA